jgi:hypothetical protein
MRCPYSKWIRLAAVGCCAALIVGMAGCSISGGPYVGETRTTSKTVPMGPEKSVDVEIKMGAGELRVANGSSELMDGDFTYNVDAWKPEVRYDVSGDRGTLTIQQPSGAHNYRGRTRYDWDIRLNNNVPMEMNVAMGAGKAMLTLAGLNLNQLNLKMGAGEADVDLDGAWQHDLSASIQGGVGKLTLHLPSDMGVRARVQGGLGAIKADEFTKSGDTYTNSAYGKSRINLNIDIQGGMGEVDLMLGGGGTV